MESWKDQRVPIAVRILLFIDSVYKGCCPLKGSGIAAEIEATCTSTSQTVWRMLRDGRLTRTPTGLRIGGQDAQ